MYLILNTSYKSYMKLLWGLFKQMSHRHIKRYSNAILTIFFAIVILCLFSGVMEFIKSEYAETEAFSLYIYSKFGGIQTVFIIAAIAYTISRLYTITLASYVELNANRALKVSRKGILLFIGLQIMILILLTVPLGFYVGIGLTRFLFQLITDLTTLNLTEVLLKSISTIECVTVVTGCSVFLGVLFMNRFMERKLII